MYFQDGRSLQGGEIISVGKDEILLRFWASRMRANPLRFARADCERLEFSKPEPPGRSASKENDAPAPLLAVTAQLAGASWLAGELRSTDEVRPSLIAGGNGLHFVIPRAEIRWLYAGEEPEPLFAFTANNRGMQNGGWWGPASGTEGPAAGGKAATGVSWIEHEAPKTPRFEVAFVLPEDAEDGARLSFELTMGGMLPDGPGSYRNTIELEFGRDALFRHAGRNIATGRRANDPAARRPIPEAAQAAAGPVAYRLFFDGPAQRLVTRRNGVQIDDWSLWNGARPSRGFRLRPGLGIEPRDAQSSASPAGSGNDLKIDQIHAYSLEWRPPAGRCRGGEGRNPLHATGSAEARRAFRDLRQKGGPSLGRTSRRSRGTLLLLPKLIPPRPPTRIAG